MQHFFTDIFDYHHHFNQLIADQLIDNTTLLPAPTIPLFSHIINAHQIWNARIVGEKELGVRYLHSLERCKQLDSENRIRTLEIIHTIALDRVIDYTNSRGHHFHNPVREILFHVANHTSHHRGQIISDLRQSGVEPLVTDYIFYKR